MYYLGVDLGGTNIKAALVTESGEIVKEASIPTNLPRTGEEVCDDIVALCGQLAQGEQVASIGIGCPGTVDHGVVLYSNNLDCHGRLSESKNRYAGVYRKRCQCGRVGRSAGRLR